MTRPLGLKLVVGWYIVQILVNALFLFYSFSGAATLLFGSYVSSFGAALTYLLFMALMLYLAVRLWHFDRVAMWTALGYEIFRVVNSLVTLAFKAKLTPLLMQLHGFDQARAEGFIRTGQILALLEMNLVIYILGKHRKLFFDSNTQAEDLQ